MNETHDSTLTSWVSSANTAGTDFPIQNLPLGVFRRAGSPEPWRVGVAIGDQILDLTAALRSGAFADSSERALLALRATAAPTLNELMAAGTEACSALRLALSRALRTGSPRQALLERCLLVRAAAEYALPARIGDYTDYYASIYHATTVGRLFRPDRPLLPNYKWMPIAYHGRSSSILISDQPIARPNGQRLPAGQTLTSANPEPSVGPSERLDYELELGVFIGAGNALGEPIPLAAAEAHVFGLCLLNDWSARDLQAWESQPLGPLLSKNFATTISPWIVLLEAFEPFRRAWSRPAQDPAPLAYLDTPSLRERGAIDIRLQVALQSARMRREGEAPVPLSNSNFRDCYWSVGQMIAHHTVNGCNLQPGDLLGSGTQSGPEPQAAGCLLELTRGGQQPLALPNGEIRRFLEDGDIVILRGWCERDGAARIGLGEARAEVRAARSLAPVASPKT